MRSLILIAALALAFGSTANAKACKDPTTGKFMKCPAAAAAPAPMASKAAPKCVKGKLCGKSCIAVTKECRKP